MTIFHKRKLTFVNALLVLTLISAVSCSRKKKEVSQRPVIQVNASTMSSKQFAQELARRLSQFDALTAKNSSTVERTKQAILDEFILHTITESWAKANNVFVRKEALDERVDFYRKLYPDDLAFRRSLSEQKLSFEQWQDRLRHSLLEEAVSTEVKNKNPQPTGSEISNYYNKNKNQFRRPTQVKIKQIVSDSEENAKRILKELKSGKNFSQLATKYSITPDAQQGGELGWIDAEDAGKIFAKAFSMRVGALSPVVKSDFGYHLYIVLEKRKNITLPLKAVKDKVRRILIEKKEQAAYSDWLEGRLRETKVLRDDDLVSRIKVETRGLK